MPHREDNAVCLNCQFNFKGNFCPQSAHEHRIDNDFHQLWLWITNTLSVFNFNFSHEDNRIAWPLGNSFGPEYKRTTLLISIDCNFSNDHYSIGNVETFKFTIRNLLNNAIKFSPIGSKIEIKIIENGNVGKVSIQDFGIGMDHKRIEKIISGEFQYSELGTNAEKGSGIGLALCNELLQKQGWKLNIESLIGIGTEIHLILPINNSKNLEKGKFQVN